MSMIMFLFLAALAVAIVIASFVKRDRHARSGHELAGVGGQLGRSQSWPISSDGRPIDPGLPAALRISRRLTFAFAILAAATLIGLSSLAFVLSRPDGHFSAGGTWGRTLGTATSHAYSSQMPAYAAGVQGLVAHQGGPIFLLDGDTVHVLDAPSLRQVAATSITNAQVEALAPDGSMLYVCAGNGRDAQGQLTAFSITADGALTRRYATDVLGVGAFCGALGVSPDGATVYLTDENNSGVLVSVDATTGTLKNTIALGPDKSAMPLAINPVNGRLVMPNNPYSKTGSQVLAYDPRTLAQVGTFKECSSDSSDSPDAMTFSLDGKYFYVMCGSNIYRYDANNPNASTPLATASLPVSGSPGNGFAWADNGGALWVLAGDNNFLLLDPSSLQVRTEIKWTAGMVWHIVPAPSNQGVLALDSSGVIVYANPSAPRMTWWMVGIPVLLLAGLAAWLAIRTHRLPQIRQARHRRQEAKAANRAARQQQTPALQAQQLARQAAADHRQRMDQIIAWEAAYRDAHGGQQPPPNLTLPQLAMGPAPAQPGTNVLAILSLIFGLSGGLLGIIFGHVALSQISHTRERGRGLALTGLVFGYLWLAAALAFVIYIYTQLQ